MRYFLTRRQPPVTRVLLIESGARELLENIIPGVRETWGENVPVDLVTCYAGMPAGLRPETTEVFRVTNFSGPDGRKRLFRELAARRYSVAGIICSAEPIMTKWKWAIALRLPAKVFVMNENGDYFWLDRAHSAAILHFIRFRMGLAGQGAVSAILRLLLFPFTVAYLILYAAAVHFKRALRKSFS